MSGLAIWLVTSSLTMGGGICYKLFHPYLSFFECISAAAPIGFTLSSWLSLFLKSYLFGMTEGITKTQCVVVSAIQTIISAYLIKEIIKSWDGRTSSHTKYVYKHIKSALYFVIIPFILWFTYIHYTHSLLKINDDYYVGGTVYGDMPFHLMIISSFLFGINQHATPVSLTGTPAMAAFYADAALVYPYLPDYHIALICGAGASIHFALTIVGILLSASFILLIFFLNLRLTSSVAASALALPIILMSGGTGGFTWLLQDRSWQGLRSVDHILVDSKSGTITICWFNLAAHILLPQRTTQYAYPIAIIAIILMLRAHKGLYSPNNRLLKSFSSKSSSSSSTSSRGRLSINAMNSQDQLDPLETLSDSICSIDISWDHMSPRARLKLFCYGGVVTGLLPMLQAHSFVSVGVIMLTVAALQLIASWNKTTRLRSIIKNWAAYGVCAFIIATPQLLIYLNRVAENGFIRILPIWFDFEPDPSPLSLWWNALGLFIPLSIISIVFNYYISNDDVIMTSPSSSSSSSSLLSSSSSPPTSPQRGDVASPSRLLRTFSPRGQRIVMDNVPQKQFLIGFWMIFVIGNVVIFQPWVLDNTKVFYMWLFGCAGPAALLLVNLWNDNGDDNNNNNGNDDDDDDGRGMGDRSRKMMRSKRSTSRLIKRTICIVVFGSLILSGGLCLFNETLSMDVLFNTQDLELALWMIENAEIDSHVAISTSRNSQHMRPEAALAGRAIMSSYWGWISNHGMPNHSQRNHDINYLLSGGDTKDLLEKYGISHVVVDFQHIEDYDVKTINDWGFLAAANGKYAVYVIAPTSSLREIEDCMPEQYFENGDEEACLKRRCVWVPNGYNQPWCQFPAVIYHPNVKEKNKLEDVTVSTGDCGWFGIKKNQCVSKGCIWNTKDAGPHCQYPISLPHLQDQAIKHPQLLGMKSLSTKVRDCGWSGMNEQDCVSLNCKWNPNSGNIPWCIFDSPPTVLPTSLFTTVFSLPSA